MGYDPLIDDQNGGEGEASQVAAPSQDEMSAKMKLGVLVGAFIVSFLIAFFPIRYLFCGTYCSAHEFPRWIIFGVSFIVLGTLIGWRMVRRDSATRIRFPVIDFRREVISIVFSLIAGLFAVIFLFAQAGLISTSGLTGVVPLGEIGSTWLISSAVIWLLLRFIQVIREVREISSYVKAFARWLVVSVVGVILSTLLAGVIVGGYALTMKADIDCDNTASWWAIAISVFLILVWTVIVYLRVRPRTRLSLIVLPLQLSILAAAFLPLMLIPVNIGASIISGQSIFGFCL